MEIGDHGENSVGRRLEPFFQQTDSFFFPVYPVVLLLSPRLGFCYTLTRRLRMISPQ
jgi:hypothetical protein